MHNFIQVYDNLDDPPELQADPVLEAPGFVLLLLQEGEYKPFTYYHAGNALDMLNRLELAGLLIRLSDGAIIAQNNGSE